MMKSRNNLFGLICLMVMIGFHPKTAIGTINLSWTGSSLFIDSDADDDISVTCKGGQVFVSGTQHPIPCSSVIVINVNGGPGNNTIQLFGVMQADFTALTHINVDAGNGNDVIIGSDMVGIVEELHGDSDNDTIFGGDGPDFLYGDEGDDILNGGLGNDEMLGGPGNDLYRFLADGGGEDTVTDLFGEGDNDRITFASNESGDYNITPTFIERGADKITFDNRECVGGFKDGEPCVNSSECRNNDRVNPDDGFCLGFIERATILGDTPVKSENDDIYRVKASRATIFTIADLSQSAGDSLFYDHRQNQPACPMQDGDSIITEGGVKPVFFSGIENITIEKVDCQNAFCRDGTNDTNPCFIPNDCPGGACVPIGNTFEDGCELLNESAFDCGGEGIPDACQPIEDCNHNGRSDVCDPDSDTDGIIDDCDNCPFTPNFTLGTCVAGITGACSNNADCGVGGICDNNQLDTDGDGVGDVCDNCVTFCNPRICHDGDNDGLICSPSLLSDVCPGGGTCMQFDGNSNGVGDVCEIHLAGEIRFPPTYTVEEGCDPTAPIPCACVDYEAEASYVGTGNELVQAACNGGDDNGLPCFDNVDCDGGTCDTPSDTSMNPPHLAFAYNNIYEDTGMLFAREKAPDSQLVDVFVEWRDLGGAPLVDGVANPLPIVQYFLNDDIPVEIDNSNPMFPYSLAVVNYFRNVFYQFTFAPNNPTNQSVIVQYNSDIREFPNGNLSLSPAFSFDVADNAVLSTNPSDVPDDAYVVVLWANFLDGPMDGIEVIHIKNVNPEFIPAIVGQQLEIPPDADCRADDMVNETVGSPPVKAAWLRSEVPLDVWPIRPNDDELDMQIIWSRTTPLAHCWPVAWRQYTADWPVDPQTYVVDKVTANAPDPPLVDLPLGENFETEYCNSIVMYDAPAGEFLPPPFPEVNTTDNNFTMRNPGWAVLRFDKKIEGVDCNNLPGTAMIPTRASVSFEVIRAFDRSDDFVFIDGQCVGGSNDSNPCNDSSGCPDGTCSQLWNIGTELSDSEHDSATINWPYGYLHSGQPFAPCIYDDTLAGCLSGESTGQIFPVNSGDFHGSLEAWWFVEGLTAPGIFWPHKVGDYYPVWPTTEDPSNTHDDPFEIIIASRFGAGTYPADAEIYLTGLFNDTITEQENDPGWNPNDEHAILLSSSGEKRAYAARDDNPWDSPSGHPYVIVQYRDEPSPLSIAGSDPIPYKMGVHIVVGEQDPITFDYTRFAFEPADECGCFERADLSSSCSDIDPDCLCDVVDPVCACDYSNPSCDCSNPSLVHECVGGSEPPNTPCSNSSPIVTCDSGGVCVSVDPLCPCDTQRCMGGSSVGRGCSTIDDCDCNNEPIVSELVCERVISGDVTLFPEEPCSVDSDCCGENEFDCRCVAVFRSPGICLGSTSSSESCFDTDECIAQNACDLITNVCVDGRQNVCMNSLNDGQACAVVDECCFGDETCLESATCLSAANTCGGMVCFGGRDAGMGCIDDTECENGICAEDCSVDVCVGSINQNQPCLDNSDCACASASSVPVVAGLPLEPLFPVNLNVGACTTGSPPQPQTQVTTVCIGGSNDGELCTDPVDCPGNSICTRDGVFVDRTGVIWAAEGFADDGIQSQWCVGGFRDTQPCNIDDDCRENGLDLISVCRGAAAAIRLFENWPFDDDRGCQPWRAYVCIGGENDGDPCDLPEDCPNGLCDHNEPYPIVFRPGWPSIDCLWPDEPTCPRPVRLGETIVDQTNQCGAFKVLHDSAGIKLIDTTHEVMVEYIGDFPPEVDFRNLPPHLFAGEIGGTLPFPDRIRFENNTLIFRGIMSERDLLTIKELSVDTNYHDHLDMLYDESRLQLMTPLTNPEKKFVSAAHASIKPGWVVLAFQNDDDCAPVGSPTVQVWRVDCDPDPGRIRVLTPTCPFNEKQVLQHTIDGGGEPEGLTYQWQWAESRTGPWNDYAPPSGPPGCTSNVDCYADGVGLREVIIAGSSPFTLGDSWWRVRYRGYSGCPCIGADCNFVCPKNEICNPDDQEPWAVHLLTTNTKISKWSDPMLAEGWIKRVLRGLNPFDQRIKDFHNVAASTYVNLIEQAGIRFEAPVALNCTPENINTLDLIPAYETVLGRARLFSIDQGISYGPANLALLLITNQISELYMLLGNEAFADSSDPTIGFFGDTPPADPTAAFSFEGQVPDLLEEELAMLRGRSEQANTILDADGFILATPYNRLLWNFLPGTTPGRIAYANNYQFVDQLSAIQTYPQGHGDAWGHYLTVMKKYYRLMRHPVFEWINSTEFVLIAGQQPLEVTYQYERKFAEAAAAKAKTGAAITSLTFREMYNADPSQQDGYPDPSQEFPDRRWGVADWARRSGQGAYFDWLVINALLDDDDDDPDHLNTIRKVDRATVTEIGEIATSFAEIQTTLNNADAGLNPLGLATTIVPFGLDPDAIESGNTHFDQIYERAKKATTNAVRTFNYANENTRRLRNVQNDSVNFATLISEQETDFRNRLIEIFGTPYSDDIGPGATYTTAECPNGQCPDIFHYDYVDISQLFGFSVPPGFTTFEVTFRAERVDQETGAITEETVTVPGERHVNFNVATNSYGLIKPLAWMGTRSEPGAIQLSRSELLQALGKYGQALIGYQNHLALIRCEIDTLKNLYRLNDTVLKIQNETLAEEITMRALILAARIAEKVFENMKHTTEDITDATIKGIPSVIGVGLTVIADPGAIAKGTLKAVSTGVKTGFQIAETGALIAQATLGDALATMQTANSIRITGAEHVFAAQNQISAVEKLIREEPARRLELYTIIEALKQAAGKYESAVGKGLRLLEQRTAFRQKTAVQVSQYRYQDAGFRIFRNEALQKYRAQFDMAARYVYLAARAYDYETNLLGSDTQSGRQFLTDIIKERLLGSYTCTGAGCTPQTGNGLADSLARLNINFGVLRSELGFNSATEFDRTFSLRWELFRIPNTPDFDDEWQAKLEGFRIPNLNNFPEYNLYAQPLQGGPLINPAMVIPFGTTVQSGQNFFGIPSTGDETLPSDRFAIKLHEYGIRFEDYPGAPLNNQVNVYLIPVGADVMRVPICSDAPIREWHLIDQTLPIPFPIGTPELEAPDWVPWDALDGGAAALVRRRLIPSVAACDFGAGSCDTSFKLTGRSVWNTQWMLIIPESELAGDKGVDGINVLIHGPLGEGGVKDIKLLFTSYGYSGCAAPLSNEADEELDVSLEINREQQEPVEISLDSILKR